MHALLEEAQLNRPSLQVTMEAASQ